jgi:hypothetical protein
MLAVLLACEDPRTSWFFHTSKHEYPRVCVYRVLMWFTGFKLESAHHPFSESHSLGRLLAVTKRTVKIAYGKN